jgi:hypothetical protein
MCGHSQLAGLLDHAEAVGSKGVAFGGLNAVMTGDFFQLPPVGETVLYRPPSKKIKKKGTDGKKGYDFYYLVIRHEYVVCFETNRRAGQQEYASLQDNVRLGNWDAATVEAINSRVDAELFVDQSYLSAGTGTAGEQADVEAIDADTLCSMDADYCPTVVKNNNMRQLVFEEHMRILSEQLIRDKRDVPILILANIQEVVSRKRSGSKGLEKYHFDYLKTRSDDKFDRMPYEFYLFMGAYVLFSHNLGVQYGIANGTRGRIIGWQFPEGTQFEETTYKRIHVKIPLHNVWPDFVLVQLANPNRQTKAPNQPPNLPDNVIAVPVITHTVREPIKIPVLNSNEISAKIKITQLPIRQAQVLTSYAIQGNQYKNYIIAELHASHFYIMFSRGSQGLESLSLRHPITAKFVKDSKPKKDLLKHIEDLQTYNQLTINKLININTL